MEARWTKGHRELFRIAPDGGWTTVALAAKAGIDQSTASRLLNGTRGPGLQVCRRLTDSLGIDIGLWFEADTDPRTGIDAPDNNDDPRAESEGAA